MNIIQKLLKMYCDYFGFKEKPFNITPDPSFLYLSPGHEELLTSIVYGIQERKGLVVVVGDVGTGKTTMLNTTLDWLSQKTKAAYVCNYDMNFEELLAVALFELGLAKTGDKFSKIEALQCLNEFARAQLSRGGNVAIIVDEAQNLDFKAMENLRLLSNMETPKHKLIQIVLCGQPELDTKLDQPELVQLKQRVSIRRRIQALNEKDTYEYIQHRLEVANHPGSGLFETAALKLIWEYSGGVPRKINILCDNALVIGFKGKITKIGQTLIKEALIDLRWKLADDIMVTTQRVSINAAST
jgi:general secretion pathway protein A